MKKLTEEFKAFIMKGNVVDLAVGVIIGTTFGGIVTSLVADVITPFIGLLGGKPDFSSLVYFGHKVTKDGKEITEGGILIGKFINAVISFLITAVVIFFVFVKPINKLKALTAKKEAEKPIAPPVVPEEVRLLAEIRDLLKR